MIRVYNVNLQLQVMIANFVYTIYAFSFFRHPVSSERPRFAEVCTFLNSTDEVLLNWSSADKAAGQRVTELGAPLSESVNLYPDLQNMYNVPTPDRKISTHDRKTSTHDRKVSTMSTHNRKPSTGSIHDRKVSTIGSHDRKPSTVSVHDRKISTISSQDRKNSITIV